jgi:hypothetical protein
MRDARRSAIRRRPALVTFLIALLLPLPLPGTCLSAELEEMQLQQLPSRAVRHKQVPAAAYGRPKVSAAHVPAHGTTCDAERCAPFDSNQQQQQRRDVVARGAIKTAGVAEQWWKVDAEAWVDVHDAQQFHAEVHEASSEFVIVGEP